MLIQWRRRSRIKRRLSNGPLILPGQAVRSRYGLSTEIQGKRPLTSKRRFCCRGVFRGVRQVRVPAARHEPTSHHHPQSVSIHPCPPGLDQAPQGRGHAAFHPVRSGKEGRFRSLRGTVCQREGWCQSITKAFQHIVGGRDKCRTLPDQAVGTFRTRIQGEPGTAKMSLFCSRA